MSFGSDIVDEGNFGQLTCTVMKGDPPFSFQWSLHGDIVHTEPGLSTSQIGGRISMLMINSVGHRHSGHSQVVIIRRHHLAAAPRATTFEVQR